jgi:hypothetical protein
MTAETLLLTGIGTCLAIAAALIVMLAITFAEENAVEITQNCE